MSIVSKCSDLTLRDSVVVITSQVVANSWLAIDSDNYLRLGLVGSQPFKGDWLVEHILAKWNSGVLAECYIVSGESSGV